MMRILYGIQGTGNGHLTRARAMAAAFEGSGLQVDYLVSGRDRRQLFGMEPFRQYLHRRGLSFATRSGRISPLATVTSNRPGQFLADIRSLPVQRYDLIVTDFEPVTAWAGRLRRIPVVGLGHQYAFRHPVPQYRGNPLYHWLLNNFAPADQALGLHWHHFDTPVLPPIAPVANTAMAEDQDLILVYLPFESPSAIRFLLNAFQEFRFSVYHPEAASCGPDLPHIRWCRPNRDGFQADLHRCGGVICNAGFELASEVLQLGRKLLVKPVGGQPEQYSNALALTHLKYGYTMASLDPVAVARWLSFAGAARLVYPDVAGAVCQWLRDGARGSIPDLSRRLWAQTVATRTAVSLSPEPAATAWS